MPVCHPREGQGPDEHLHAEEPVCLLIWMDKKFEPKIKTSSSYQMPTSYPKFITQPMSYEEHSRR